jgi:hypothetical protein
MTNFTIPPLAPAAVAEAYANYDRVCDQLAALQGELVDARDSINAAAKDAIAQDAAAIVDGGKVKGRVVRQDRETAIAKLEQQIRTLEEAAHLAGNQLADSVAAAKDEWVPVLQQAKAEAAEGFRAAIKVSQEAAKTLGDARRAAEWLADFDAARAKVAGASPFSGGTLRVKGTGALRGEHMVVDVLKLCEQGAEPAEQKPAVAVGK